MISVVVPVYDGAAVLPATVPAVLALDGVGEVVWVDDGSRDGTRAWLEAATADAPCAQVVGHPSNRGRAAARNTGAAVTTGDVLVFLDADVEPPSDAARRLAAAATRPGALAAVGRFEPVPSDPDEPYQDYAVHFPRGPAPGTELGDALDWRFFLSGGCAVRREAFEAVGGFDVEIRYGEDYVLGHALAALHRDGLRFGGPVGRLHDVGDLGGALEGAEAFGHAVRALDPSASALTRRLARFDAFGRGPRALAGVAADALRRGVERMPPGPLRRRGVRYLLALSVLRASRRA